MKKIFVYAACVLAVLFTSCEKKAAPEAIPGTIEKSFEVFSPATKTELSGMNVLWSEGDEINVIAANSGNQYTFKLKEGAGTNNAKFSGKLLADDAEETQFFAVYPNVTIRPASLSSSKIEIDDSFGRIREAVKDGFDAGQSVMTAQLEEGKFNFRHGSAYFKVKIEADDIDSLVLKSSNTRFSGRPVYNIDGSYNNIESAKADVVLAPASGMLEKDATYYIPVLCKNSTLKVLSLKAYHHNGVVTELSTEKKASVKLALGSVYDLGAPYISTAPKLILNTTSVNGVPSDAANNLKIENAYTVLNGDDSNIYSVTYDGIVVTSVSIDNGTITYGVSANTGTKREGWIGLSLSEGAEQRISIEQLAAGASENYVWDFSSAEWQAEFAKMGEENKDITNWNLTYDGLTIFSTAKSKYRTTFFQWGGKGSTSDRYMKFTTSSAGTVSVYASFTGSSAPTSNPDRHVSLVDSTGKQQDADTPTATANDDPEKFDFKIAAGEVKVFCSENALRFYKIEFHSN